MLLLRDRQKNYPKTIRSYWFLIHILCSINRIRWIRTVSIIGYALTQSFNPVLTNLAIAIVVAPANNIMPA